MPGFDFTRVLGSKFRKAYEYRRLVLLVVDVQDFDGSFRREAADLLAAVAAERDGMRYAAGKENISGSGKGGAPRAAAHCVRCRQQGGPHAHMRNAQPPAQLGARAAVAAAARGPMWCTW